MKIKMTSFITEFSRVTHDCSLTHYNTQRTLYPCTTFLTLTSGRHLGDEGRVRQNRERMSDSLIWWYLETVMFQVVMILVTVKINVTVEGASHSPSLKSFNMLCFASRSSTFSITVHFPITFVIESVLIVPENLINTTVFDTVVQY